jgi:hypothetical protein
MEVLDIKSKATIYKWLDEHDDEYESRGGFIHKIQ